MCALRPPRETTTLRRQLTSDSPPLARGPHRSSAPCRIAAQPLVQHTPHPHTRSHALPSCSRRLSVLSLQQVHRRLPLLHPTRAPLARSCAAVPAPPYLSFNTQHAVHRHQQTLTHIRDLLPAASARARMGRSFRLHEPAAPPRTQLTCTHGSDHVFKCGLWCNSQLHASIDCRCRTLPTHPSPRRRPARSLAC